MKKNITIIFLLLLILFSSSLVKGENKIDILVFWGRECYNCTKAKLFLYDLEQKYPGINITSYEVFYDRENLNFFKEKMKSLGEEADIIPTIIINDMTWVGFTEDKAKNIEDVVKTLHYGFDKNSINEEKISFIKSNSIYIITFMIALVDGLNPCSLWVLTYLLGLIICSKSRKKMLIIGLPFLITSACIYGLFIFGIIRAVSFINNFTWFKLIISLFTLVFAVVNIKDYFYFQKGISFTIAGRYKPGIIKKFHFLKNANVSNVVLIGMTILTAVGITLIELPCTAGFPLLWSNIMAERELSLFTTIILYSLYIFVYFIDELLVLLIAVFSFRMIKINETKGRNLKLISGMIMLFYGLTLLCWSELLSNFLSSVYIFTASIIISTAIIIYNKSDISSQNLKRK